MVKKKLASLLKISKKKLIITAENAIGNLYTDIMPHIMSDSWQNFRNELMNGLQNYNNRKIQGDYDFRQIRESIYSEYKEEIIIDLNQDLLKENKKLNSRIDILENELRHARGIY